MERPRGQDKFQQKLKILEAQAAPDMQASFTTLTGLKGKQRIFLQVSLDLDIEAESSQSLQ